MKFDAKTAIIGRKPRVNKETDEFKAVFLKLFDSEHPLRGGEFPTHELDFPNIEYASIQGVPVDFYSEGNDIVVRGVSSVDVIEEKNKLVFKFE